jgi:acetate kinase
MPSILVINSGSSSLKFSLIDISTQSLLLSGIAEKIGLSDAFLIIKKGDSKQTIQLESSTHQAAMEYIFTYIQRAGLNDAIVAIGHRVVHGGEFFKSAVLIDDAVIKTIEDCIAFAPLHNPAHLEGIRAARLFAPTLPQVAVFDTAFHQTLSEHAYLYALPMEYYQKYGVRRYGFHGTSHQYVSQQAALLQHKDLSDSAYITAHLGNGASITAVLNGKSVDTSMGFTPLEGLVMGTRTGDIDPAIIPYLASALNISASEVVNTFNKKSGLLGLSGLSSDMRELQEAAAEGHTGAAIAIEVFVHRLAKYIGAMTTSLPRVDALIFTGGNGENSAIVRSKTLKRIQVLGYKINEELNDKAVRGAHGIITTPDSIPSLVINTNEELMIALDTAACININNKH